MNGTPDMQTENQPLVKYRATVGWADIAVIKVERETEQSVWIKQFGKVRRYAKRSGHENYFDSFDEAKSFLLGLAANEVSVAKARLDQACKRLAEVQMLR